MTGDNTSGVPAEGERPPLGTASSLARFALIGTALAAVTGAFTYLGGWLTPNDLTPGRLVDAFESVDGVHTGFRRNHAKGVGVSGFFESNGRGARLSKAVVFRPGRVPVIGRFSLAGGRPYVPDTPDAGARSGATVLPPRRRTLADRDDQPAGLPGPDPRGFLRAVARLEGRPHHGPARPRGDEDVSRPPPRNGAGGQSPSSSGRSPRASATPLFTA